MTHAWIDRSGRNNWACLHDWDGLQFESRIGNAGLIINPGESQQGYVLMENSGYILLEDGTSFILLE